MSYFVYLGVDPGRDKTGAALMTAGGILLRYDILPTREIHTALGRFLGDIPVSAIVMGNGTTSESMKKQLAEQFPRLPIYVVNEYNSTQEAKELYWQLNPPKGLKRLLPRALLSAPAAVDGLAAAVLIKRYLENRR